MEEKVCQRCGLPHYIDEYLKDIRYADGYYPWCKICRSEYRKSYAEKNKDKIAARMRRYHLDNIEKQHDRTNAICRSKWANDQEYRERKNKQKRESNHKKRGEPEWLEKNREWGRNRNKTRRKRELTGGEWFTESEWKELCDSCGNRCLACGKTDVRLTCDHVVPVALGGKNSIDNIQPLCPTCNQKKHTKVIDYRKQNQPQR